MSQLTENVSLTETQEQSVHAHGVHAEECMGDEVWANHHSLIEMTTTTQTLSFNKTIKDKKRKKYKFSPAYQDGYPVVVQGWSCILKGFHSPREEEEGKDPCGEKPQRIYKYNSHVHYTVWADDYNFY